MSLPELRAMTVDEFAEVAVMCDHIDKIEMDLHMATINWLRAQFGG